MKRFCRLLALCMAVCLLPLASVNAEGLGADLPQPPEGAVTAQCTFTLPEGFEDGAARLTDGRAATYTVLKNGDALTVQLPGSVTGFTLGWHRMPTEANIELLDASGAVTGTLEMQPYLNAYYALENGAAAVRISGVGLPKKPKKTGYFLSRYASYMQISEFQAFAAEPPETVQRWESAPEKPDVLFIAATPEAAACDFFAPLAFYAVEHETPCALVVMSVENRAQTESLLSSLWAMGVRQYPILYDYRCDNNDSYNLVSAKWGKKAVRAQLKELLEQYTPQVVVTHAGEGAALNAAAQFTSEYVLEAAQLAGVSKVYTAGSEGTAPDFTSPLTLLNASAADAAKTVYEANFYETRAAHPSIEPAAAFTLVSSAVGEDSGSLLDNITPQNYVARTPVPTATPEPTAAPTPTAEPAATAEAGAFAASAANPRQTVGERVIAKAGTLVPIVIAVLGFLISIVVLLTYSRKKLRKRRKKTRVKGVVAAVVPFAMSLLLAGAAWFLLKDERTAAEAAAPAAMQTESPSPTVAPTDTPAPIGMEAGDGQADDAEPEADPAAAQEEGAIPSELAQYFRQDGEEDEVIVVDEENGHWEYRTDYLSILIDRHTGTYTRSNGKEANLVKFVAHIRTREVNAFRTAQADTKRDGAGAVMPWIFARRAHAVLMVTGDNLIESDTQYKSVLIRDGKVFQDSRKCDVLAMYPDATMKIFSPQETSADALLMDGVRDAFSFGPSFIIDGELQSGLDVNRLALDNNPRTGIGLVEPGHYVVIVVDGRRPEYSYGMSLEYFAQLFVDEGCTQAYNLDGGVSACMLFMGEQLNHHGNQYNKNTDDSYQRRIPDGLVWGYSAQVPSEFDPIYNDGKD